MTKKMILALALLDALPVHAQAAAMERIERLLEAKLEAEPPAYDRGNSRIPARL
jgi:hypothetical protein